MASVFLRDEAMEMSHHAHHLFNKPNLIARGD